ncbi:transposable element Tcb1 transposase [Trichonephila clavipes]|nr:transposable element Tcb1 transposase [Trichonephila clavipes]
MKTVIAQRAEASKVRGENDHCPKWGDTCLTGFKRVENAKRLVWYIFSCTGKHWTSIAKDIMEIKVFANSIKKSAETLKPYGLDLIDIVMNQGEPKTDLRNIISAYSAIIATQVLFTASRWLDPCVWWYRCELPLEACIRRQHTGPSTGMIIWGAIGYTSQSPLFQIDGTLNSVRYISGVLRPIPLSFIRALRNFMFRQDKARPHAAGIVRTFLDTEIVRLLAWTVRSPDVSPIENVWLMVVKRLARRHMPISTIALIDTLNAVGIEPAGLIGEGVGELLCGYVDGSLTAEQIILAAYWIAKTLEETQLEAGAMLDISSCYFMFVFYNPNNSTKILLLFFHQNY